MNTEVVEYQTPKRFKQETDSAAFLTCRDDFATCKDDSSSDNLNEFESNIIPLVENPVQIKRTSTMPNRINKILLQ